jgi:hypothetical protein
MANGPSWKLIGGVLGLSTVLWVEGLRENHALPHDLGLGHDNKNKHPVAATTPPDPNLLTVKDVEQACGPAWMARLGAPFYNLPKSQAELRTDIFDCHGTQALRSGNPHKIVAARDEGDKLLGIDTKAFDHANGLIPSGTGQGCDPRRHPILPIVTFDDCRAQGGSMPFDRQASDNKLVPLSPRTPQLKGPPQ